MNKDEYDVPPLSPKDQGFVAAMMNRGAVSNPYWPDYGKQNDATPEEERINARFWVDGWVSHQIESRKPYDPEKLRNAGLHF